MSTPDTSSLLRTSLDKALRHLAIDRPVFHSEADFQHGLAWALHKTAPDARVRLETRPLPGVHLDLLAFDPATNEYLAVELKYLTAAWTGTIDGETYRLLNQGAHDIRAYDVVKDVQRVESFVDAQPGTTGAVVVLSNEPSYWRRPNHTRPTNADAFRIYQGNTLNGTRAWGPNTGPGTTKGRAEPLRLQGSYECYWADYSTLADGARTLFRYLKLDVHNTPDRSPRSERR